jgi:arginase
MKLTVVGVPFNSSGLSDGVARAPAALRRAGLVPGLAGRLDAVDGGDVRFDPATPGRSPTSGLLAERALVSMVAGTRQAVADVYHAGRFPLLLGGDCPVMLGALAATRDRHGEVGLLMLDGHEDAYPPRRSPTGEAADSELALALGLADGLPDELAAALPLVAPGRVGLLGPRDDAAIAREGVASLRGVVPLWSDVELVVRGPAKVAAQAARDVAAAVPAWWLHVDLDVLATAELSAVDYPQPGGLRWWHLRQMTAAALAVPGCAGWTVAIYNPDLDPDGGQAARIVGYVVGAAATLAEPPGG